MLGTLASTLRTAGSATLATVMVHIVILIIVIFLFPMWIRLSFSNQANGQLAMQIMQQLRDWSRETIVESMRGTSRRR